MNASQPSYKVAVIARLLNLTERRVQQLAKDNIIPKPVKGNYDLIGCVQGYIRYLQERDSTKAGAAIDSHIERGRLLKAKADKAELEVKTLQATYIPAADVERIWCSLLGAFRAKLLALPMKLTPRLAALQDRTAIHALLTEQVDEALTELSQYEPDAFISSDTEMSAYSEAAAETDGEPVGGYIP